MRLKYIIWLAYFTCSVAHYSGFIPGVEIYLVLHPLITVLETISISFKVMASLPDLIELYRVTKKRMPDCKLYLARTSRWA
jgi:hypothetical protein